MFKSLLQTLTDMIFPWPDICMACDKNNANVNKYRICKECWDLMPFIVKHYCYTCGKQLAEGYEKNTCPDCRKPKWKFRGVRAVLDYNQMAQDIVYRYKYGKDQTMCHFMGDLMTEKLGRLKFENVDMIIPVPLHKLRQKQRGFNQSELLAKKIGSNTRIKVRCKTLLRVKDTSTQTVLNRSERERNLANAFSVKRAGDLKGKNVLLIDDIYTTGATVNQCSKVLKDAGAVNIYVLVFATGRNT